MNATDREDKLDWMERREVGDVRCIRASVCEHVIGHSFARVRRNTRVSMRGLAKQDAAAPLTMTGGRRKMDDGVARMNHD
jgi:hypothetical protein